jgi:3-oxoadipate enol-lactonase
MLKHKINGLNVLECGEGNSQAIIFIHAFPLCSRMWDNQAEYFQNKFRVITYDLRGFGYSETPECTFTIDTHVDDLMNITGILKLNKPVICGLSMGGYIALRTLELHQDKFKAAVLSDTKSEADTNQAKINRFNQIKQIKSGDRKTFIENFIKNALSEKNYFGKPGLVDFLREIIGWQSDSAITGALLTLAARTDTTDSLKNLNIPALVISGEEDKLIPVEFAKSMNSKIKGSALAVIKNSGHFPNTENPEEFNMAIENFLIGIK